MSNKQRLQVNNTNLSTVLSEIGDLPLKSLVEAAAQQGQYVWKKIKKETISFTQTNTGVNPVILQCSSDNVDLSKLTVEDFYGYSGAAVATSGNVGWTINFSLSEQGFTYNDSGSYTTVTYDATKAQLKFGESFSNLYSFPDYDLVNETTYIVDNDSNKYPNGAMQDGYWYELVIEGMPLPNGFTKFSVDKYVPNDYPYTTTAINHSLGVLPKIAIISTQKFSNTSTPKFVWYQVGVVYDENGNYVGVGKYITKGAEQYSQYTMSGDNNKITSETVTLHFHNDIQYKYGEEYTLITMA